MNQRRAFLLKGISAGSAIAAAKIAGPIAAASALPPTHAHGGTTLFVSPQGRDTNDGTTAHQQAQLHGPLATLTAALRRLTAPIFVSSLGQEMNHARTSPPSGLARCGTAA